MQSTDLKELSIYRIRGNLRTETGHRLTKYAEEGTSNHEETS
jgi:hypothetical protein